VVRQDVGLFDHRTSRCRRHIRIFQIASGVKQPSAVDRWFYSFRVFGLSMGKGEPTSGLEPLSCSLRVITQALQGFARDCKCRISRGLSLLRLMRVAPYCVPGGVRVVSEVRGLHVAGRLCARWVSSKGDDLPATALVHARPSLARMLVSRCRGLRDPPHVWLLLTDERPPP
jgi:hypothetical protein